MRRRPHSHQQNVSAMAGFGVLIKFRFHYIHLSRGARVQGGGQLYLNTLMRHLILMTFFLTPFLLSGQSRAITGKIIAEWDLEGVIQVRIQSRDTLLLGTTDMNGKFRIELPSGTDQLLLTFIGMEPTSIRVPSNCDNLEIIMMYSASYDFTTLRTVNRKRSKMFKDLPNQHQRAHEKGIFTSDKPCFEYIFNKYK